ncbi:MAG: hypothetical protein KDJ22_00430 [Candidatus Competibacteraceae bacterium]|nr:hypothetical protein [Candidatus Competibacteraceae bacterium]
MTTPTSAEVRHVSTAQDPDQLIASLPSNVEPDTITQLKELAEHLQDLSTLLQPEG